MPRGLTAVLDGVSNLEGLGVVTAIARPPALTSRSADESGKVVRVAARISFWVRHSAMEAYPLTAPLGNGASPPHHALHKLRFVTQLVCVGTCVHQAVGQAGW
jgi:hypothetical protein